MPTAPSPRVLVSGMPIATIAAPYVVAGCPLCRRAATARASPAQWMVGAVRVTSLGQPLAIMTGVSICAPTGTPLMPVTAQTRVLAT